MTTPSKAAMDAARKHFRVEPGSNAMRLATAFDTFAASQTAALLEALKSIRDGGGMLSQPAALNCPELEWANKRIQRLESIAHQAISAAKDNQE
jgi:hypothetical protein